MSMTQGIWQVKLKFGRYRRTISGIIIIDNVGGRSRASLVPVYMGTLIVPTPTDAMGEPFIAEIDGICMSWFVSGRGVEMCAGSCRDVRFWLKVETHALVREY